MMHRLTKIVAAAACLACAAAGNAQPVTMKLSSPTANDITFEWMKAFKAGAEDRSGGKLKIELYPANQLGQIPRTVEGVAMGTIEVTIPATGFLIGLEPRFQIFDAMGLFDNVEHAMKVFHDADIRMRLAGFGASKGVEPLAVFIHSPNELASRKPVRSLADIAGQKIRVPGSPLLIEPLKKLGAAPLSMPLGEVLPALQNGTIDGALAGTTVFTAFKYYDVVKARTRLPSSFITVSVLTNRKFLASLGKELETVVREEAAKADAAVAAWGVEDIARSQKIWEKEGGQNIALSAADQRKFLDTVGAVTHPILTSTPQFKEDYDAFAGTAQKYRR
jgi:C4-dicarboxylate-binding protein DctP